MVDHGEENENEIAKIRTDQKWISKTDVSESKSSKWTPDHGPL